MTVVSQGNQASRITSGLVSLRSKFGFVVSAGSIQVVGGLGDDRRGHAAYMVWAMRHDVGLWG